MRETRSLTDMKEKLRRLESVAATVLEEIPNIISPVAEKVEQVRQNITELRSCQSRLSQAEKDLSSISSAELESFHYPHCAGKQIDCT
jgi:hypothetical protein